MSLNGVHGTGGGVEQSRVPEPDRPPTRGRRLAIVAAIPLYRDGLARSLSVDHGFDVVGTAEDARGAAELLERAAPDVLLIDISAPGSLDLSRAISRAPRHPPIVALALPETEEHVIACAEAGVSAYVPPEASLEELASLVRRASCGEALCSPHIAGVLIRRVASLAAERPDGLASPLTAREQEIVALIDEGLSNKEIAARLFIEVATVKNHVHNVLEKLDVRSRGQAARRMRALGQRVPAPAAQQL